MERKIRGSIVLASTKSLELFDSLAREGMLLEYLAVLIEEKANGTATKEYEKLMDKFEEINQKLDVLIKNGGTGVSMPSSSIINKEPEQESKAVEKTKVDLGALKGKSGSMLSKMRQMRRD